MDFRILGHLEALDEGRVVTPRGAKQRALLALFLVHANETLSTDWLIEGLWGERPPTTAAKTVQVHVSHLRKALALGVGNGADGVILTRGRGYELRLDPRQLDSRRFEALVVEGRGELAEGRPERAVSTFEVALSLWAGPALADLAHEPFAQREIARLDDLRVAALEQLIAAQLELGRHEEVVPQLEALIREHPYRERYRAQLMLALYRSDRQAEALQAYHDARRTLVEQLGIEPGDRLRELEHAILAQDPTLALPAVEAPALPPELDDRKPLVGRQVELERLHEHWQRARQGAARLVLVTGPRGIGKTRLAAELAAEVLREGGGVLYASAAAPPETARAVLADACEAGRPTLVLLDDVDLGGQELLEAASELVDAAVPVLVLATAEDASLAAALGAEATLTLEPLDADGMRAVAQLYVGASDAVEVPLERLAAASGGVPERLHRAAREWARAEAARRLGTAAGHAASERTGLRAAEEQLTGRVVELQAISELAEMEDAERPLVACPFKGLESFEVEDTELFFGRERLVARMVARLSGAPLMGIVGPSGSGKSSALRAGLLAALAGGVLPGSERWPVALLRPGEHPLRALERAIAAAAPEERLVVAVDQFEEVFALCGDESERGAFIDALVSCARYQRRPAVVLVAVRADFYGRCAAYPELSLLLDASHVLVGPMRRDELRRAIELPARRADLRVEKQLVDALVADVEGQPGALPLLSTSLLELWQRRDGRRLHLSGYEHTGGVHGAVARLAESAYMRLDPDRRELARRILLRLAGEGEGETVVRRRVPLAELGGERDERVAEVVAGLADARLVTIGEGEVEVAHEALLREWPRLRAWLEEGAEGRRLQLRLGAAAREWVAGGRDPGELYRGARLASALDWSATHQAELNASERAFMDESRAASERSQRRLRAVLAGVAALLVLAVIAGLVALDQRGNARHQALAADAQRLGAQALTEDQLDRALLLARQGVALDDTVQTRGNLLAVLLKSPAAIGVLRGDGDRLLSLDLSPDGRTLAVIDDDGTLSVLDTRTRRPAARPRTVGGVLWRGVGFDGLRFSDDGSRLAVGGWQPLVLDTRRWRVLARLQTSENRVIHNLRFSRDGHTLFAVIDSPHRATAVQRFDARSGLPLGRPRPHRGTAPVIRRFGSFGGATLIATQDGKRLVTTFAGGPIVIRDARTLRPLRRLPVGAEQAALSPDDRTMLVGGGDGSVRFLDLVGGNVRIASGRHDGAVVGAAFSADGRTAVTAGEDKRVIVWNVERAAAAETLAGHAGQITGLAISRDGRTLHTAGLDGNVLIWDLAGRRRLGRPFDTGRDEFQALPSYALRPDGRVLAVGHGDGTVTLIDPRTLRVQSTFRAVPTGWSVFPEHRSRINATGPVQGMGYVPGGRLLVVGGDDGFLAMFDPRRGKLVKPLPGHRGPLGTPSFSADGRLMATLGQGDIGAGGRKRVLLWTLKAGQPLGRPRSYSPTRAAQDVSLSPDGRTLAVTEALGVEIIDVATRRRRASLPGSETVRTLARFTPDGRFIVGGSTDGWARLWSTDTWRPATRPLAGHTGEVTGQSTSPDAHTLATGSTDGTIRLFDLATQRPLGAPLPGLANRLVAPQFTPDGAYLFAITGAGRAYRWDVRPSSWARHACAVAGRQLTRSEWADVLPEHDYDPAC